MSIKLTLIGLGAAMLAAISGYMAPELLGWEWNPAKADMLSYPAFHLECRFYSECQDV